MSDLGELYLHGVIGRSSATSNSSYTPPVDWINIDDCDLGNINLLVADTSMATYAFVCTTSSGQYHVDWGDGTSGNYNSGTTAQHTYSVGTGQICSRGYTTFKIIISPISGDVDTFKITSHSLATQTQDHHILACVFRAINATSLGNAFYKSSVPFVYCRVFENIKIPNILPFCTTASNMFSGCYGLQSVDISGMAKVTTTAGMFSSCYGLQSVDVSSMAEVTTAATMFNGCYGLRSVDVSSMAKVTNATSMFSSCYGLQNVDVSNMIEVTNATGMFGNCYGLQSVDISDMTKVTNATGMFSGCYGLSSVLMTNFALISSSTLATSMFDNCQQLLSINLPNTKVTKLGLKGASGTLNKVQTIEFHPSSTFSDATAPQLDLQYTTLTATQLDAIFTSLPTVTGKTVNITGSTGAATCTRTIATAKGWTVTG